MRAFLLLSLGVAQADQSDFYELVRKFGVDLEKYTQKEIGYFRDNFERHFREARDGTPELFDLFWESEPQITEHKLKEIEQNNGGTWKAENSKRFEGWSVRDTKRLMGTFVGDDAQHLPEKYTETDMTMKASDLPENFDSRDQWGGICPTIKDIRDQSTCGSCWAFGSTESFNDRSCIASGGKMKQMLSAEHTVSCCGFFSCLSMGCNGGHPGLAWRWLTHHGVVTGGHYGDKDTCWPYEISPCSHHGGGDLPPCPSHMSSTPTCKSECTNKAYSNPFKNDYHAGERAYMIHGVDAIKEQIYKNGPVAGGFIVYDDFPAYKEGVYVPGKNVKPLGGHAIKILGWGKEDGLDYWLVANSWNTSWGIGGFFKIQQGAANIDNMISAGDIGSKAAGKDKEEVYYI